MFITRIAQRLLFMTKNLTYKELEERVKDFEILESYHHSKQQLILEAITAKVYNR